MRKMIKVFTVITLFLFLGSMTVQAQSNQETLKTCKKDVDRHYNKVRETVKTMPSNHSKSEVERSRNYDKTRCKQSYNRNSDGTLRKKTTVTPH